MVSPNLMESGFVMIARIKYAKRDVLKYISHLDLQRCFHRLMRRAEIEMRYSEGFNPHPKVSYAMAMPVGMTSEGEYLDVEILTSKKENEIQEQLNKYAPKGLEILQVKIIDKPVKSLTSIINEGIFIINMPLTDCYTLEEIEKIFDNIMSKDTIEITKKNKKGKEVIKNIRPFIKTMEILDIIETSLKFKIRISIGSRENLNPRVLMDYMKNNFSIFEFKSFGEIHRIDMKIENDINPIDYIE